MSNRKKWLMLFVLSFILTFVVWKHHGPALARAVHIDPASIKMPNIPFLHPEQPVEQRVQWLDDIDIGIATCRQTGQGVLIYFAKPDDAACKQLSNEALNTEPVAAFITDRFVPVKIEHTDPNSAVARKFGINAVPTLVVYGPDGKHADTLVGLPKVPTDGKLENEVHDWLKDAFAKVWGI